MVLIAAIALVQREIADLTTPELGFDLSGKNWKNNRLGDQSNLVCQ
jgi:hypothetical protein